MVLHSPEFLPAVSRVSSILVLVFYRGSRRVQDSCLPERADLIYADVFVSQLETVARAGASLFCKCVQHAPVPLQWLTASSG